MTEENNQNLTQGEQPQAPEAQEQSQAPKVQEQPQAPEVQEQSQDKAPSFSTPVPPKTPEVTGYEGTGHEKDPLKTKPSTGREGTEQ